jgi:polyhydroxyalkanoate synthesis repressor PhaR
MTQSHSSNANAEAAKVLRIRKYPNRRYYDSTRSRHLTLEEIYAAVRDGYEIEVADSKTGEDITAKVLAQIIIDLDPPKLGVFPVPLLHRLLRANEQLVQDFTQKYFNQALEAFLDSQRKFEQSMREALGLRSAAPTVADWTKLMWSPFNPMGWNGGGGPSNGMPPPAPSAAPAEAGAAAPQADELRRQIAELQKQLAKQSGKRPRASERRAAHAGAKRARRKSGA